MFAMPFRLSFKQPLYGQNLDYFWLWLLDPDKHSRLLYWGNFRVTSAYFPPCSTPHLEGCSLGDRPPSLELCSALSARASVGAAGENTFPSLLTRVSSL